MSCPAPETRLGAEGDASLEVWGGVECTLNRVGETYLDQLDRTGHSHRPTDLDRFASLGITALRYPLLWERIAPRGPGRADWSWADARMDRLHRLGLKPIVGLVHHGSGPRHTSLLDDSFVDGLEEFAGTVARRYPWVRDFTPVNEPLTTARFSALYGFWYPHRRDLRSFVRALLVQCRAIARAMRAVRETTPAARLVQTEDFGRTYATSRLAGQARYENQRRFLSLDLLTGRVTAEHSLWRDLIEAGADPDDIEWLGLQPPPDVIGVNYYLTSDRLLDTREERYPVASHGGNGRQRYADVEAVRAWRGGLFGHEAVLRQLHRRYGLPLAVTEAHAGATREDQLRWLQEAWDGAQAARRAGADVRAVTAWALLGSCDWNRHATCDAGYYEPGAFDVRNGIPRPTAVARMIVDLAAGRVHDHPVLAAPRWWRRDVRLAYPPVGPSGGAAEERTARGAAPILIAGGGGTLGRALERACGQRGLAHQLLTRDGLDVADPASVARALDRHRPWAVANAAGYVRVDAAETDRERCFRENVAGAAVLAAACARRGVRLLTFSSDLVFDGTRRLPYVESTRVAPLGVYGASKARAEVEVQALLPGALIVRTSAFFGPHDRHNFLSVMLRTLENDGIFTAASDVVISPTYVPDLVEASLDLLVDGERGIWHLANDGAVSWVEFARLGAALAGLDPARVSARALRDLPLVAPRPAYSALGSERGRLLPSLEDSLRRWAGEREMLAEAG